MELRIQTLGGLRMLRGGEERPGLIDQPTRAAVLVYLAMERDVTRDVLQGIIWSALPPDRARHSLNQTLYLLRKELGEDWIETQGARIRVTESLTVDALDFERRAKEGSAAEALTHYGGEFLEGWYLRDTPEFEQWTDRIRLRLARLHREARRTRLSELRQAGRISEALDLAKEWVWRDPQGDRANHALIELLALSGRRKEALEHYETFAAARADELLPVAEDTRTLVDAIRNGTTSGVPEIQAFRDAEPSGAAAVGPGADAGAGAPAGRRTGRALIGAATLVALGVLLFAALSDRSVSPAFDPDRVLVFPLENRTGDADLDPAGMLAADWITRSLARADFLGVFPTSELLAAAGNPPGDDGTQEEHLARAQAMARATGCGTLVTGAFYGQGSEIEFHVQVLQAPEWELLESVGPIRTDRGDPMEAVAVLGQRVLIGLAFQRDERLAGFLTESERPPSYAAYVASVEGFREVMTDRWREAARDLLRANEISPEFTSPLIPGAVALMRGWGDFEAADSVLRIVEASRDRLPPYDRLRLDMVRAILQGDNRRAYRAAQEAATLVPGASAHISSGLIAVDVNRPRDALEWLGTFNIDRGAGQHFALYWDMFTQAHHVLGEFDQELRLARRAREYNQDRIEFSWYEIRALAGLGRLSGMDPLLDESQRLGWTPEVNPGFILVRTVEELQAHGFPDESQQVLARFPSWFDSLDPQQKARPDVRTLLGRSYYLAGRLDAAQEVFSELRNEMPATPLPVRYLGVIAARTGDTESARAYSRELDELSGPQLLGRNTLGMAAIAARLGEREQAVAWLRRAVSEGVRFGAPLHSDPDLSLLEDYAPFRDFMRPEA